LIKEVIKAIADPLLHVSNLSTSKCTMIMKETIDYYRTNGNDVYCAMLDANKAFDPSNLFAFYQLETYLLLH